MNIQLRDYQVGGIRMLNDAIRNGYKRIVWCFPTGAGKSTITSAYVKTCIKHQKRVLFFVHRKELVNQFAARLMNQFNILCGIIMAGVRPDRTQLVQVASIQTLSRREVPKADIVFIDEAHHAKAASYQKVIKALPNAIVVGLTATPFRTDGKGLNDIFETIVHPVKINTLIKNGYLVKTECYAPEESIDLAGIRTVRGDYDEKELYERFTETSITKGVIDNYLKFAEGKQAIVFNVNVAHSIETCENFVKAGIKAAHIDAKTPKQERNRLTKQFAQGVIKVLCNVAIFTEGYDVPAVECVILNRATKSLSLYVQMVGRGLRPAANKASCIVLDHGENVIRHGFVRDYDGGTFDLKGVKKKKRRKTEEDKKGKQCDACFAVNSLYAKVCDKCQTPFPVREKKITFVDGSEFKALGRDAVIVERLTQLKYKQAVGKIPLSQLRIFEILRGFKKGWFFHAAIDYYLDDIDKSHPTAWEQVKFRLQLEEQEGETEDLYQQLKKQRDKFQRQNRTALSQEYV